MTIIPRRKLLAIVAICLSGLVLHLVIEQWQKTVMPSVAPPDRSGESSGSNPPPQNPDQLSSRNAESVHRASIGRAVEREILVCDEEGIILDGAEVFKLDLSVQSLEPRSAITLGHSGYFLVRAEGFLPALVNGAAQEGSFPLNGSGAECVMLERGGACPLPSEIDTPRFLTHVSDWCFRPLQESPSGEDFLVSDSAWMTQRNPNLFADAFSAADWEAIPRLLPSPDSPHVNVRTYAVSARSVSLVLPEEACGYLFLRGQERHSGVTWVDKDGPWVHRGGTLVRPSGEDRCMVAVDFDIPADSSVAGVLERLDGQSPDGAGDIFMGRFESIANFGLEPGAERTLQIRSPPGELRVRGVVKEAGGNFWFWSRRVQGLPGGVGRVSVDWRDAFSSGVDLSVSLSELGGLDALGLELEVRMWQKGGGKERIHDVLRPGSGRCSILGMAPGEWEVVVGVMQTNSLIRLEEDSKRWDIEITAGAVERLEWTVKPIELVPCYFQVPADLAGGVRLHVSVEASREIFEPESSVDNGIEGDDRLTVNLPVGARFVGVAECCLPGEECIGWVEGVVQRGASYRIEFAERGERRWNVVGTSGEILSGEVGKAIVLCPTREGRRVFASDRVRWIVTLGVDGRVGFPALPSGLGAVGLGADQGAMLK